MQKKRSFPDIKIISKKKVLCQKKSSSPKKKFFAKRKRSFPGVLMDDFSSCRSILVTIPSALCSRYLIESIVVNYFFLQLFLSVKKKFFKSFFFCFFCFFSYNFFFFIFVFYFLELFYFFFWRFLGGFALVTFCADLTVLDDPFRVSGDG